LPTEKMMNGDNKTTFGWIWKKLAGLSSHSVSLSVFKCKTIYSSKRVYIVSGLCRDAPKTPTSQKMTTGYSIRPGRLCPRRTPHNKKCYSNFLNLCISGLWTVFLQLAKNNRWISSRLRVSLYQMKSAIDKSDKI
jgi:hypothetical protein